MSAQNQSQSEQSQSASYLKRFVNFITVEPILIGLNIPLCLLSISVQNLGLEKVRDRPLYDWSE